MKAERRSAERRSDTVDRLTNEIRVAFRRTWDPDEDAELFAREIGVMYDEFGAHRTERAVMQAVRTKTFKPAIAELRELVPSAPQTCWRPTAEEIREAEIARNSPEAQRFRQLLSQLRNGKRLDGRLAQ